jgi:hypothetical protein
MQSYSKPIPGLSAIQSATFIGLFRDYEQALVEAGYNGQVVRLHLRSVAHFGIWLEFEGVALEAMDNQSETIWSESLGGDDKQRTFDSQLHIISRCGQQLKATRCPA